MTFHAWCHPHFSTEHYINVHISQVKTATKTKRNNTERLKISILQLSFILIWSIHKGETEMFDLWNLLRRCLTGGYLHGNVRDSIPLGISARNNKSVFKGVSLKGFSQRTFVWGQIILQELRGKSDSTLHAFILLELLPFNQSASSLAGQCIRLTARVCINLKVCATLEMCLQITKCQNYVHSSHKFSYPCKTSF